MPAGNPAPSRAHRELALPLRRHKDRPRFGRLHDCGLGELGFAAPGGIISLQGESLGAIIPLQTGGFVGIGTGLGGTGRKSAP